MILPNLCYIQIDQHVLPVLSPTTLSFISYPLFPVPPSLFNPHGLLHSLSAALSSIQVSCLSQPPSLSIWTLAICKNGNLSGPSQSTNDKMQANILCMTNLLTPAPFTRLISSNFPQAHSALTTKKKKIYSSNNHIISWLDVFAYAVSSPRNVLSSHFLMFSDSRLINYSLKPHLSSPVTVNVQLYS